MKQRPVISVEAKAGPSSDEPVVKGRRSRSPQKRDQKGEPWQEKPQEGRKPRRRRLKKMITAVCRFFGSTLQPAVGLSNHALGPVKPSLLPVELPSGFKPEPATPQAELEAVVQQLDAKKQEWADLGTPARAKLLRACLKSTVAVAREAARAATRAKGSYGTGCGEEYMAWLPVTWALRGFAEAMEADGEPATNGVVERPGGQKVVDVFPLGAESLFFGGFKGEVWIEPGKEATQGANYRQKREGRRVPGSVALVLGAGNQTAVSCLDILHKLLFDDAVVVCKMNPVNEFLGAFIRRAYKPLVDAGYVAVVYGGPQEGAFLTGHPAIKSIHLTGSAATFDAVVWGKQKKEGKPPLDKAVGAELGCVTPYLITPGEWSEKDLQYHAEEIAACLVHNAGHNCTKVEVIVTDAAWPQREAFLEALRAELRRTPARVAWYPGSQQRSAAFEKAFPHVEKLGKTLPSGDNSGRGDGSSSSPQGTGAPQGQAPDAAAASGNGALPPNYLPWLFAPGLTPETARTDEENWCGVLQEVALPGTDGDPEAFMRAAVDYANNKCWGSLSCSLFVPPDVLHSRRPAVDEAVAALRYGTVAVNALSMLGFCFPALTWGAFPGNPITDIGSGNCAVHNMLLLDHPQKSVLWGPWRYYPTHCWSPHNRNLEALVPSAIHFLNNPNIFTLISPMLASLRG